jgi:hypothetical protein
LKLLFAEEQMLNKKGGRVRKEGEVSWYIKWDREKGLEGIRLLCGCGWYVWYVF